MFVPKSYGKGDPANLSERLWFAKYWKANQLGYRDLELADKNFEGKYKIVILGDSYVAGHGIKNPEDRFSNILSCRNKRNGAWETI